MAHEPIRPADDRELAASRLVPAAPGRVFAAFADAGQLAQWWGPEGFTNTFHEFTFAAGAVWRFTMHSADGRDFANEMVFDHIEPPTRVALRHLTRPQFTAEFSLQEIVGGTLVVYRQRFATEEECRRVAGFAGPANGQLLARLAQVATR